MPSKLRSICAMLAGVLLPGAPAIASGTLSAGLDHNVAIVAGQVWSWGGNTGGKLGNGTTTSSSIPVKATGLTGVVAVAAGMSHTLAVTNPGGVVYAWGLNDNGQLGYSTLGTCAIPGGGGSKVCSKIPQQVPGITGAIAVAAGWGHSLALKSDGTVVGWGDNSTGPGQLGRSCTSPCAPGTVTGSVGWQAGESDERPSSYPPLYASAGKILWVTRGSSVENHRAAGCQKVGRVRRGGPAPRHPAPPRHRPGANA